MQNRNTGQKPIFAEVPQCLCEQVMCRRADPPQLRYSSRRNEFLIFCPTCGFTTHPSGNKQSVIAEWYGSNRTGDLHIESLWRERFDKFQQEKTAIQRDDSWNSGTTVPL